MVLLALRGLPQGRTILAKRTQERQSLLNSHRQSRWITVDLAETLEIDLLFLPSYSPNLNLIERYWKYLKGKRFRCRSIEKYEQFCTSIIDVLEDRSAKRKKNLSRLRRGLFNFST